MSTSIGFRCPASISEEIKQKVLETGKSKSKVVLEMIEGLPSVRVEDRKRLPGVEAIYLVWTADKLLYIGQTSNLGIRFMTHHRLVEFLNKDAKVSWFKSDGLNRLEIESSLIDLFCPELNGTSPSSSDDVVQMPCRTTKLVHRQMRQAALDEGLSVNEILNRLLQQYLEKHNKSQ